MLAAARRLEDGVWRSASSEDATSGGGIQAMIASGRQVQVTCPPAPLCALRKARFNICRCVQLLVKKGYAGTIDYTKIQLSDCKRREIYQVTAGNRQGWRWPQLASWPGGPLESGIGHPPASLIHVLSENSRHMMFQSRVGARPSASQAARRLPCSDTGMPARVRDMDGRPGLARSRVGAAVRGARRRGLRVTSSETISRAEADES